MMMGNFDNKYIDTKVDLLYKVEMLKKELKNWACSGCSYSPRVWNSKECKECSANKLLRE